MGGDMERYVCPGLIILGGIAVIFFIYSLVAAAKRGDKGIREQ